MYTHTHKRISALINQPQHTPARVCRAEYMCYGKQLYSKTPNAMTLC